MNMCIISSGTFLLINLLTKSLTEKRVTENMKVVQWSQYADRWPQEYWFSRQGFEAIVDLLMGIEYFNLHVAYIETRGEKGDPIARRALKASTCMGFPENKNIFDSNTNVSMTTLFTISRFDVDAIN